MGSIPGRKAVFAAALLLALLSASALAQTAAPGRAYPVKPIRLVVPFPAGASSDIVGRMLGQKISEQLGEQVVPDNRAGAGGNLGMAIAAKAPPDGYTIAIATSSIAVSPSLYANLGYDPVKDLAPVARLTSIPNVLLVHPSVPAKTLKQFISLARANPGKLKFGSGGAGTTNHLANELLKHLQKIDMVHVPYKGVTQAMTAMMGGEVDEVVMPVTTAIPQVRAGKVRALAVLSEERVATLPEVPTGKEAGVEGLVMPLWYGMFAPAATPRELVNRLNAAIFAVVNTPELREAIGKSGFEAQTSSSEQFTAFVRDDIAKIEVVVKGAGLQAD